MSDKIEKTDEEWRALLPRDAYQVLRHEGTEYAGSSPLNDEHRKGTFVCAGCGMSLFRSDMKYESGSGWPSFFTSLPGVFETSTDHKLLQAPHRIPLHALRRPSRPYFRRRPGTDRTALLQQRCVVEIRSGLGISLTARSLK